MTNPGTPRQTSIVALVGDVMTGRGIDQALAHPSDPRLHEEYVRDAREYLQLAKQVNGPIPHPVDVRYIWGDAVAELDRVEPAARIINLETSVTRSDEYWPGKGIHYRMHPANVSALAAGRPDVAVLANNHVMDYGASGLQETLDTLGAAGIRTAGAGRTLAEARSPATVALAGGGTLSVFACGAASSGIPSPWAATGSRPGVHLLPDLSRATAAALGDRFARAKQAGGLVVASIHWGSNWGYEVSDDQIAFAHRLIESGADIVHGHSSHHVRPIEVYRDRLVLYGCGDFITDYEGIGGHGAFRDDLVVLYLPAVDAATGALASLLMVPLQLKQFRVRRASPADARWLADTLDRIGHPFGSRVRTRRDGRLGLEW